MNTAWFVYYGRKLGMTSAEVWACPMGEMLDMLACMQIENGAEPKRYATMDDLFALK